MIYVIKYYQKISNFELLKRDYHSLLE